MIFDEKPNFITIIKARFQNQKLHIYPGKAVLTGLLHKLVIQNQSFTIATNRDETWTTQVQPWDNIPMKSVENSWYRNQTPSIIQYLSSALTVLACPESHFVRAATATGGRAACLTRVFYLRHNPVTLAEVTAVNSEE